MTDIAIRVEDLGKLYHIGGKQERYRTLRDTLADAFAAPLRRASKLLRGEATGAAELDETIWALKDVSVEVKKGEVVGIIGRNGAGKTTLLKILSKITEPTEGHAEIHGRVGSLLEVGTGFHPELTGRENIYLNGAILGMKKAEIDKKLDEIVDFSGVEKFIDTPVKHYSSGMYVRLAFAVAAHLDPEILLVDEVLAVGDAAFQKKCLGKMGDVARAGRTVLFVSHNMGAVRSLCNRGLLLSFGQLVEDGMIDNVVDRYLSSLNEATSFLGEISWDLDSAPGSESFRLRKIELVSDSGEIQSAFIPQEPINVRIRYQLIRPVQGMRVVLQVRTATGEIAFTSTDHFRRSTEHSSPRHYTSICRIPGGLMNLGDYYLRVWAGVPGIRHLLDPADYIRFSITGVGNHGSIFIDHQKWPGVVCPRLEWTIMREGD